MQQSERKWTVWTGTRILVYEKLKHAFVGMGDGPAAGLLQRLSAGLASGAIGQLVAVPAELIKVG